MSANNIIQQPHRMNDDGLTAGTQGFTAGTQAPAAPPLPGAATA